MLGWIKVEVVLALSWPCLDIEFTGWEVGGEWCVRLTQLKVMLGWIEVELGF